MPFGVLFLGMLVPLGSDPSNHAERLIQRRDCEAAPLPAAALLLAVLCLLGLIGLRLEGFSTSCRDVPSLLSSQPVTHTYTVLSP